MVSIIVTERERFRFARESLLSLFAHLEGASEIVYVTGKPPMEILSFLEKIRKSRKNLKLILANRFLKTNEARSLGLAAAKPGNDIAFVDNDVIVRRGWLTGMLKRAKRNRVEVVMPLIFEGGPEDECHQVHDAGSTLVGEGVGLRMVHNFRGLETDWRKIKPCLVDVIEMHCLFVKRKVFEKITLDEKLGEVGHPFDFSMNCKKNGIKMMVEPSAHVLFTNTTLLPDSSLEDLRFFLFKFSEKSCSENLSYLCEKWGIDPRVEFMLEKRSWPMAYKGAVFSSFGVLNGLELLVWRAARLSGVPSWFRRLLEKYMMARIFTGARNRLTAKDLRMDLAKG